MVSGWLFDAYPLDGRMIFWIKQKDGKMSRIEDKDWTHSIYVASDDKSLLKSIVSKECVSCFIKNYEFTTRYETITDTNQSQVLRLGLMDPSKALTLASIIERIGHYGQLRLYNVDVLPAQSYFYEHDIFPLAFCQIKYSNLGLQWNIEEEDGVLSTNYELPTFRNIHLRVFPKVKEGKIPNSYSSIDHIEIKRYYSNETIRIKSNSEADTLEELVKEVENIDPDFILTDDGDSFTLPYLIDRCRSYDLELNLSREKNSGIVRPERKGTSYFSYGRIYFKPSTIKLLGRIHIDTDNSFIISESGLQGLYELARICRMPLHTASRASIGKCMSSLQFYYATKKNVLIPWKPTMSEYPKNLEELLIADRGGMILEPEIGVFEKVAELDFVSLYPNIMFKKNISAETILCNCCPDSKLRVPELKRYYRCEKRKGIVPTSIEILLTKRKLYKDLRNSAKESKLKEIYDSRQTALKWVLVTSFGYLGFNNAKFGRIDAHIAVCAFDRQVLIQTIRIAERHGFDVLHAIVDSIWIKKRKINATQNDYQKLKEAIEKETGFEISLEGEYKWIAFVPLKNNDMTGAANRYFGVFEDGTLKTRGIEARRHDTPPFFSKVQQIILAMMAEADTVREVKELRPRIKEVFQMYLTLLWQRKVSIEDLVLTKRISKDADHYQKRNTVEMDSILKLKNEGKYLKAGQILKYIITDYYHKKSGKRSIPTELVNSKTTYDVKRYSELFTETCNSITEPFGLRLTNE